MKEMGRGIQASPLRELRELRNPLMSQSGSERACGMSEM